MNIGSLLARHARYCPNYTAVVFEDCRLSFRYFNARVNRLANGLASLNVKKGDKVATILAELSEPARDLLGGGQDRRGGCATQPPPAREGLSHTASGFGHGDDPSEF